MDNELEAFIKERNRALTELDLEWGRQQIPFIEEERLLPVMHKARYECTAITDELRLISREWLEENGWKRFNGLDFTEELPR